MEALNVVRHAKVGFAVGVAVAALVYVYRVFELLGPVRDPRGSPWLFLLLAFVLAVGVGVLVTLMLVSRAAIEYAREND